MIATRRLLIANDDHHLWSFLAHSLVSKLPGCAVECVGSFDAALESVERNPPGAVLVDLTMGGARGMDVVRKLRASGRGARLLIIGMTGEGSEDYRRRLREAGADDCLTGPCNAESLIRCLNRLASRTANDHQPNDHATPPVGGERAQANVLLRGDSVDGWYLIKGVLGQGAGSVVYEAADGILDETVAIKVLRSTDRDPRARFELEGQVLKGLRSPHVPVVHLVGALPDGSPYIVMERMTHTLADRLLHVSLELDEVLEIGRQLLAACTNIHDRGIVHRDIKPSNIGLTGETGSALSLKLFDFGVCVVLAATDGPSSPHDALIGTPEYMAPEQVLMSAVDARTDLYAVGVVLYECITGRMPFQGGNFAEVVAAVLRDPVLSPAAIRPECPPWLEHVVLRALSRDMNDRFQSAAEMAAALAGSTRTLSGTYIVTDGGLRPAAVRVTADATTVHPLVRKKAVSRVT